MREARKLCPDIIFVEARPYLYVDYHHRLVEIVESCTPVERTLSIDEMVCRLTGSQQQKNNALALAAHIKQTLAYKAGNYIRSSIGIAPNMFLAKVASDMQKPDGCVVIQLQDLPEKLFSLELRDLYGIGKRTEQRLKRNNIFTVRDLYAMNPQQLRAAWGSIEGERLYEKLRGREPYEVTHPRSSLGHSHVLPPELRTPKGALSVLHRLLQKACMRLRNYGLHTASVRISIKFMDEPGWSIESACAPTDDTLQLTQALNTLWQRFPDDASAPYKVGVSLGKLMEPQDQTLALFPRPTRTSQHSLDKALDTLNLRYGKNAVYFGGAHNALNNAPMRISFNHIPDPVIEGDDTFPTTEDRK